MNILFIQTGGTIDKDYPKVYKAYSFEVTDPAVERILERVNPVFQCHVMSVLKKDSMDITDEDRQNILLACKRASQDHIVITHGTDTMVETARTLGSINDKVIILTGSARPERFSNSDADFNVGVAVGALGSLQGGVYIAMNGVVSKWDEVQKDPESGQFISMSRSH